MSQNPQKSDVSTATPAPFRNHRKVYVERYGLKIPQREVTLDNGEDPVRLYDTSGPAVDDHRRGLPRLREEWIRKRADRSGPGGNVTQLHFARRGEITEEMYFQYIMFSQLWEV